MHKLATIAQTVSSLVIPLVPGILRKKSSFSSQIQWPSSMDETVDCLLSRLSIQDKAMLKAAKREDLLIFRRGLANGITKDYGLNKGNELLLAEACGEAGDANEAATKIIEMAWLNLHKN